LILSIFLAIAAQFTISRQLPVVGASLYLASAIVFIVWARRNPKWTNVFAHQLKLSTRVEIILATLLLLAVTLTRFYDLGYRVYGLEADETKWTVQSWYSAILRVDQGEFASAHYQYLPVSFWVRSFFLRIFGMNFVSARVESALFSLLAAVFIYFMVRRLTTSPPVALLSTLLYSFSFVELNVSHQALHNTTIEIWMMSGLFLFILALQERKLWQFQLAGIVLALGMLTYETYFPTPLLAVAFSIGYAIYRISRKKDAPLAWLKRLLLLVWPIALLYVVYIHGYIVSQSYHFEFLTKSSSNGANLSGLIQFLLQNTGEYLDTMFVHVVWTDSLINWGGPFINPLLIVFVVVGLIYNLLNIRRSFFVFIPLWFVANLIYAPILVGSVWPRVLYTTLGPLAIWGAMGLWVFLAALRTWFDGLKLKFALPVFAILLVVIVFNDYHIFTSSLTDPMDRQKRRELADVTAQSAAAVPMVLFPYEPNQNDSVYDESHVLLFSVAAAHHAGLNAVEYYQQIPFDQTLLALYKYHQLSSLDLVFDKTPSTMLSERTTALQVILHCYPDAVLSNSKRFFDVFHFDSKTLAQPNCYQGPPPTIISPQDGAAITTGSPLTFEWDSNGVQASGHSLTLEQKSAQSYWIEAEDTFTGPGWYSSAEYVNGFSGNGFLLDSWEAEAAQYSLPVQKTGQYRIWIRSYKRQQNDQVNFISINGKKTEFASNNNALNTWVWEDLGEYSLSSGDLPMALTRTYGNDPEYSVFIDAIVVTPDLVNSPDQVHIWEKILETGPLASASTKYTYTRQLPPGEYRWKVRIFDGNRLIDSTGANGVESPAAIFTVNPR
jgi:4-amino-4-deoxy-L-arabinose transferase-like glycosyltransferase